MKIQFSKQSFDDLDEIEDYLLDKWNDKVLDDFNLKLDRCIELIMDGSVIFQKYEDTTYHKVLITKHNTMIYSLDKDTFTIHRISQNFQNPEDNYESLK